MKSKFFSTRALLGLNRIGDVLLPGSDELPSFSAYGGIEHIDDLVAYAPADDIATLGTVMAVLSYMPGGVLHWLAGKMSTTTPRSTGMMAPLYRQLNMGVRGILFSLYYSGKPGAAFTGRDPLEAIGYSTNRVQL
jgi:hypothetical protein